MTSERLLHLNLAVSAVILLVLILRLPVRRLFGARIAYGLWALVPLAAGAMLLPARVVTVAQAAPAQVLPLGPGPAAVFPAMTAPAAAGFDPVPLLLGLWLAGVAGSLLVLAWRQGQFTRAMRRGTAGPAVVGVLKPRVVTPADFAARFTHREQQLVLDHEATHIARQDCRINALVALTRCLSWFNPLVHLMGRALRIDQELACDAAVAARHPSARRAYAEAMLKAQLAVQPLPLGCYWAAHPLTERIRLLARPAPGPARRLAGAAMIGLAALATAGAVWASLPERVVLVAALSPSPDQSAVAPSPQPPAPSPSDTPIQARTAPGPSLARAVTPTTVDPVVTPQTLTPAGVVMADRPMPARFDPNHRFGAAARRSSVAPGFAVRVLAEMTDPRGIELVTDMTSFGSQSRYRTGWYWNEGSQYALFTAVVQQGDRFLITVSLDRRFAPETTGSILLADGQAGEIIVAGQKVRVRPTLRRETPQEMAEGQRVMGRI